MIQKQGHWVPYELKPRDVERRFGTCELLLQRQKRKGFLTGDRYRLQLMRLSRALKEKRPLYAQRHDKVILLHDNARPHVAKPVKAYLETLKWEVLPHPPYSPDIAPSDFHLFLSTITGDRYRLQLMRLSRALKEKRPLYAQRHDKVILLHDNARPHVAKPVKTYLETLKWEVLPHPPYSPDIAPSDFHLFRSMAHGLADRRFHSYEEAQKWIDSWIASKDMSFFRRGIHVLPERWEKVVSSDGQYFK
ncbi:MOS1T transposase, partial [Pseudoatta argentina]